MVPTAAGQSSSSAGNTVQGARQDTSLETETSQTPVQRRQTPKTYTPQESLLYLFHILSYLPRTGGYHGSSGEDAPLPSIVSRSGYRAISGAAQPISALSVKNASLVGGGIRSDRRTADQPSVRRVFRLAGSVRVRPARGGGQPGESARGGAGTGRPGYRS